MRATRFHMVLITAAALAAVVSLVWWLSHSVDHVSPPEPPGSAGIQEEDGSPFLMGRTHEAPGEHRAIGDARLPRPDGDLVANDPAAWEFVASGLAVREQGEVVAGAIVQAVGADGGELGTTRCDDSGRFTLKISLSGEVGLVCVTATVVDGTEALLRSLPWYVAPKRPPAIPPSAVLILRSGASISGTVAREDGSPVLGAVVIAVCEVGSDSAAPLPGWEVASFSEETIRTISGDGGRFALTVRPGTTVIRASLGGAQSEALRVRVPAGSSQDVGALRLSSDTASVHLRIVDASGAPCAGAWVQLDNRTLRFGSSAADSTLPTLRADAGGRIELKRLVPSDFPLVLAAGTPAGGPSEIRLPSAPSEEVVVRLPQRPGLILRLPAAACQGVAGSPFAYASCGFEQLEPPPAPGLQQMRAPAEMIAGVLQEDCILPDSADPCVGHVHLGAEAKYRITFSLRGVPPVNLVVLASRERTEVYDVPLPSGQWVRLRSALPAAWQGIFRCAWHAGGVVIGEGFNITADALRSSTWCFAPAGVDGVSVAHAQPRLLDVAATGPAAVPTSGGDVDVLVQPVEPVVEVSIGIVGNGHPLQLADWPIQVIPIDRDGATMGPGVTLRTDPAGRVRVATSARRLRVVALQRLGTDAPLLINQPDPEEQYLLPIW